MRLACFVLLLFSLVGAKANAQAGYTLEARCAAAYRADDTRGQIKWCKAAADRAAAEAQHSTTFWLWAGLEMEGVDLLDLSIAYNSAGDPLNAYTTAIRSRAALQAVRFHCPLYAMRDLATEPLRRVNDLINLYESPASPVLAWRPFRRTSRSVVARTMPATGRSGVARYTARRVPRDRALGGFE
jgi:hypothetical protein